MIDAIIARLRKRAYRYDGRVAGSIDYMASKSGTNLKPPYLFVVDNGGQAASTANDGGGQYEWRNEVLIIAVISPPECDNDMGMRWAAEFVRPVRDEIYAILAGWEPGDCYMPMLPVSAEPGAVDDERLEIMMVFSVREIITIDAGYAEPSGEFKKQGCVKNDCI